MRIKELTESYKDKLIEVRNRFFLVKWYREFRYFRERLKRTLDWAIFIWKEDLDYDSQSIYDVLEFKLKRLEKCLIEDPFHIQEQDDMEALALSITLCGRLKTSSHEDLAFENHENKWGKLTTWFEASTEGSKHSTWHASRPKAITLKQKEQERKELLEAIHLAERDKKRDAYVLFTLVQKYIDSWWC